MRDPLGKRFPLLGRDPERTPMQWDASPGAGFTAAAAPWLPIAAGHDAANVAAERSDSRSHLSLYRRLIWYRRRSQALRAGAYRALDGPPDTFAYAREHAGERVVVLLNFASETRTIALPDLMGGRVVLSTDPDRACVAISGRTLDLAPVEGVVVAWD